MSTKQIAEVPIFNLRKANKKNILIRINNNKNTTFNFIEKIYLEYVNFIWQLKK